MPVQSRRSSKYIRVVCPSDLSGRLGLREVVRSLRTTSHREALIRSYPVELAIRLAFDEARRDPMVDRTKLQELVDKLADAAVGRSVEALQIGPRKAPDIDPAKAWAAAVARRTAKSQAKPADPSAVGPRLSESVDAYCDQKVAEKAWTEQTEQQQRGFYAELTALLGNPATATISKSDLLDYQKSLAKLPVAAARRWPGIDARQVIEQTADMTVPRISLKSRNMRLAAVKSLFGWLCLTDAIARDPSVVLKTARGKRPDEERLPLTDAEALAFIAKCDADATEPAHRWLPKVSAYSGLRLDEAGQLDRDDIVEHDGVWCFRIKSGGERKLKTKNAVRLVPIHSAIRDDLLAYRETRPKGNLWGLQRGRRGHTANVGNWLGRRLDTIDDDPLKTFHSLRHSVSDKLKRAELQDYIIAAILGHANNTMSTGRYGSVVPPSVLANAVEKIAYQMDAQP